MKKFDGYLSQITDILDGAYSQGYEAGYGWRRDWRTSMNEAFLIEMEGRL